MNDKQGNSSIATKDIQLNSDSRKVASATYGKCEDCQQPNTGTNWCNPCNAERFKSGFDKWTSGNEEIDKFIQETQLKANNLYELIEWIPFNSFEKVEYLAKGGFSTVFKANWADGYIKWWCREDKKWRRSGIDLWEKCELVCLKSLNNSGYMTRDFLKEIENQLKFRKYGNTISVYGVTKDPERQDYMMVMNYARKGSLRKMLDTDYNKLNWETKLANLLYIANGLAEIHKAGLVHKDFHVGNIVMNDAKISYITDFGLCKPMSQDSSQGEKKIYGVLPYIAPEVLKGEEYTQESDVYSFGIIMIEVFTGYPPYHNIPHNHDLAMLICQGLRPNTRNQIPPLLLNLINRCLDAKLTNRISAEELKNTLEQYYKDVLNKKDDSEIYEQIKRNEASTKNSPSYNPSKFTKLNYTTHSQAVYTSRLLNFRNLPDPINATTAAETKQLELMLGDMSIEDEDENI